MRAFNNYSESLCLCELNWLYLHFEFELREQVSRRRGLELQLSNIIFNAYSSRVHN